MGTITAADYQARQSEAAFQAAIIELAQFCGWHVVHIRQMRGNPEGLPDLLMWRDQEYRLIEVKTESGKRRASQIRWTNEAALSGVMVHLVRPSDWDRVVDLLDNVPGTRFLPSQTGVKGAQVKYPDHAHDASS